MGEKKVYLSTVVKTAGAFIAFLIGSGFATGQEILQYFAAYGLNGLLTAAVMTILFIYVSASFSSAGYREQFEKNSDIFRYYCGKYIGSAYDYFTIAFLFMSYVVMIGGSGATLNQHFGVPYVAGALIMVVLSAATVAMGLGKIVDIIGCIGPFIVVLSVTLGVAAVLQDPSKIAEGSQLVLSGQVKLLKAGTNWFTSASSYVGFCMLWLICFLAAIGKTAHSRTEALFGTTLGTLGFAAGCLAMMLGLLSHIQLVANTQIPSLLLAGTFSHTLATVFSAIIFLGIYTTSVPLLWQVVSRFTEEHTKKFWLLTVVLAALGCFIGLALPFNKLVNIIYGINGYVGILLLAFIVVKDVKTYILDPKAKASAK